MTNANTYEEQINELIENWDEHIDRLKKAARDASGDDRNRYDEALSFLMANREALRRGLLRPDPSRGEFCVSCEEENASGQSQQKTSDDPVDRILQTTLDVMKNPREKYGPE